MTSAWRTRLLPARIVNLQPRRALELALRQLRRHLRVECALAGLAIEVDLELDPALVRAIDERTGLPDEQAADRAFALRRWQRAAVALGLDVEARRHAAAEQIGVLPLAQVGLGGVVAIVGAGIGHDPD